MSLLAGLALLLASLGIHGVMSYLAGLCTREIGIRMALGAPRRSVLASVAGRGMALTLAGAAIGPPGAAAVGRLTRGLLFGVSGSDGPTLIVATLVLLLVSMAARPVQPSVRRRSML